MTCRLALLCGCLVLAACGAGRCRTEGDCPCARDGDCPDGYTCAVDRVSTPAANCVPLRGGAEAFSPCQGDGDCDRGTCLIGACQPLCREAADCPAGAAGATCTAAAGLAITACLPRSGPLRAARPAAGPL